MTYDRFHVVALIVVVVATVVGIVLILFIYDCVCVQVIETFEAATCLAETCKFSIFTLKTLIAIHLLSVSAKVCAALPLNLVNKMQMIPRRRSN